jgi:hypothetical protein
MTVDAFDPHDKYNTPQVATGFTIGSNGQGGHRHHAAGFI